MRTILGIAASLFVSTLSVDSGAQILQRSLTLDGPPAPIACATLDAALMHAAAPALRNLSLTRNGQTLPFALDESYDEHALTQGSADRAFYDTVANGNTDVSLTLPARVPVERMVLAQPATTPLTLHISASMNGAQENITASVVKGQTIVPITLGANLQHDAEVVVTGTQGNYSLQMRRRWICFPTGEGDTLLQLDGTPHSDFPTERNPFAESFHMPAAPQHATLGPAHIVAADQAPHSNRRRQAAIAAALAAACLMATLLGLAKVTSRKK